MKLTQEQLAELIAKVFANLDEKRKAVSGAAKAPPSALALTRFCPRFPLSSKAWRVPSLPLASL